MVYLLRFSGGKSLGDSIESTRLMHGSIFLDNIKKLFGAPP